MAADGRRDPNAEWKQRQWHQQLPDCALEKIDLLRDGPKNDPHVRDSASDKQLEAANSNQSDSISDALVIECFRPDKKTPISNLSSLKQKQHL